MNAARLMQHFERISEVPDAVPRLRRFILDLAVRGKLVEQDPKDEPAAELLERIRAEKARLVKEGKIRSARALEVSKEDSERFQIPVTWTWCRLSEVGAIVGGGTPPSADADNFTNGGSGTAWLTPADLGKHTGLYVSHGARDLTPQGLRSSSATLMPKGSVLFTSRAPIGYTAIAANEVSTNQGFKSVVPFIPECNLYIAVYFRAFGKWIDGKASGTTFREVSGKIVANLPFPLPPLAEQHRIIAKVDELMTLCDRLEAAQAGRENRRDRLAAASLHRLNNGADVESFREHARFHLRHLPRLTTRPEHIQQLRQTILNLAARGQLVPQDPNDETASVLLNRIEKRKAELLGEAKIKKTKACRKFDLNEVPHSVPKLWTWAMLGEITDVGTGSTPSRTQPSFWDDGSIPWISSGSTSQSLITIGDEFVTEKAVTAHRLRLYQPGTLLVALYGQGKTRGQVATLGIESTINQACAAVCPLQGFEPMHSYLKLLLQKNYDEVRALSAGGAQPNLNVQKIKEVLVPLPPVTEQHRIVAKVDELMGLCDRLKTQLTAAQTESRGLLETTLADALAENGETLQEVLQT
ncbi:MAG: restriction endonuclease subunit S [Pirellulales bacterium]